MKKILSILILSLLLVPVCFVKAANDVTVTEDTNISLTSPAMTLVLESGSTYSSMTVTASTISFVVSGGGNITLTSSDKYTLSESHTAGKGTKDGTCTSSGSSVIYTLGSAETDSTVTISPSAALCDAGTTSSGGGSGSGGTAVTNAQPATGTQTVAKTVAGINGGSVATADEKAGVAVPAGLASGNVSMNIVPIASSTYATPASNTQAMASQVYNFTLTGPDGAITQFGQNVTVTFKYTDNDISGLNEDSLKIYYWDTTNSKWVLVGGALNKATNTITAEVSHFTVFGVFGDKTGGTMAATGGELIKLACPAKVNSTHACKSVYYLDSNLKRHPFPNEATFKSWYADFSGVKTVTAAEMSSYAMAANVTIRPGTYLVKITTDPKVYAVESGGKLRWIASEEVAKKLYGADWAKKIKDVPDAFFVNYDAASAATNTVIGEHPIGSLIKYAGSVNVYYVVGGIKRLVSSSGMTANNFRDEFILETDVTYTNGADIIAAESNLNTVAGN